MLTIDRNGQATVQSLPLGPESKTSRTHLTCDELAWLPQAMKDEFAFFRSSYGSEQTANRGEISVAYRWDAPEKRVVWRNPESGPKPPQGHWAALVAPLEVIRGRAEEAANEPASDSGIVFEYGHSSSGIVGTYVTVLSIHESGYATLSHGLSLRRRIGRTQLAPGELARLLQTIEEAKFVNFQQCYGRHAPVNPQNSWMIYRWDGKVKEVAWMSDPAEPKPPEGWSRIMGLFEEVRARAEKQGSPKPNAPPRN